MEFGIKPDLLRLSIGWRVYVVPDIDDRNRDSLRSFDNLLRNFLYDVYIDYVGGVKSHRASNLTYGELRQDIFENLVVPSRQNMTIYVALSKEKK